MPHSVAFVVGARPNFPKVAPILAALADEPSLEGFLVHTGQHYDPEMSGLFLEDLGFSAPDYALGVGGGSHAEQTGAIMVAFEKVCAERKPDAVIVVGDVNSTLACAIVAAKAEIPLLHVESGLRSNDRSMPEEVNRLVTDRLSARHYTHCDEADENLRNEGTDPSTIVQVGNVMIDSLFQKRPHARRPSFFDGLGLRERAYGLVTLHRPALVDHRESFSAVFECLRDFSAELPLVFPLHPRCRQRLKQFGLVSLPGEGHLEAPVSLGNLHLCPPLRYLEFIWAMDHARLLLTDSGGIQEESSALGVPCLTLRPNTERPVTVRLGTNRMVGTDADAIRRAFTAVMGEERDFSPAKIPGWDGEAGKRIARDLAAWLGARG